MAALILASVMEGAWIGVIVALAVVLLTWVAMSCVEQPDRPVSVPYSPLL